MAQDADESIEEIVVTGIRGSLTSATAIKREESGVVDAITAEDVGRFPDTNLAESLQRIPGVSIDRRNNEGNRVSVRGFGPSFNMVTLNGRQMPAAATNKVDGDGTEAQSRAFNFAEISSEAVSSVRVYKTARANVTTGGLGATLDILTAKPLDFDGLVANAKFKLNADLSNENGDDFTPEFSGIIGNSWGDGTFGLLFNGSYARRDSRESFVNTDGWRRVENWDLDLDDDQDPTTFDDTYPFYEEEEDMNGNLVSSNPMASYGIDARAVDLSLNPTGQLWLPQKLLVDQSDHERERTNAQFTAQWAPTDTFTATADWTYSEYDDTIETNEVTMWIADGQDGLYGTADETGSVTQIQQNHNVDFIGNSDIVNTENESIGLNLDWQATQNLRFKFDAHSSTSEAQPGNTSNDFLVILASHSGVDATTTFGGGIPSRVFTNDAMNPLDEMCFGGDEVVRQNADGDDVVVFPANTEIADCDMSHTVTFDPDGADGPMAVETIDVPITLRNTPESYFDADALRTVIDLYRVLAVQNDVDQYQFNGEWENADDGALRAINFGVMWTDYQISTEYNFNLGVQGSTHCEQCADAVTLEATDFPGVAPYILTFHARNLYDSVIGQLHLVYFQFDVSRYSVSEETTSAYLQFDFETEFNGMPFNALVGFRYEDTDVTGSTLQSAPIQLLYITSTELRATNTEEATDYSLTGNYELWLPSMDMDLEIQDDLIARVSFGRTLARPDLNSLRPTLNLGDSRPNGPYSATRGNPGLLPYVSDNLDLSLEWFYGEGSYASISYFKKWVDNYIVTDTVKDTIRGAPGPLTRTVAGNEEEVRVSTGELLTDPSNAVDDPPPAVYGDPSVPDHDIIVWDIQSPVNGESASVDGWEVAVQHIFGDTGFGLQANWTVVDGDIEVDPYDLSSTVALTGLSDSANLVAFYEKNGIQVRVAYTWRDEYLTATNQHAQAGEPEWVDSYGQLDLRVGYTFAERWTVFLEGINVTEEDTDTHGRFDQQFLRHVDQSARYSLGVQAKF